MSATARITPLYLPLSSWAGIFCIAVLVLLDQLTFGYGPGDYYYAMVSIIAAVAVSLLVLRASSDLRLIFALLGGFYFLFLLAKVTIIQGPMVL